MFERYTERARRTLFHARREASEIGGRAIETEHLLLALVREGKGFTGQLFADSRMSLDAVRSEIQTRIGERDRVSTSVELPFSAETQRVLRVAGEEAERLGHNYVGTEHLLLGLLSESHSVAGKLLIEKGIELGTVRAGILRLTAK